MLLSDEFQEFAHLFSSWVISFIVVAAAWAVLIMSFTVCAQQMLYNRLEFWSEMALWTYKLECILSFLGYYFLDTASDTIFVLFRTSFVHLAFQIEGFLLLGSIVFLDIKQLLLSKSQLVLENTINYLQSIFSFNGLFTKVLKVAFFDLEIKVGRQLMWLVHQFVFCRYNRLTLVTFLLFGFLKLLLFGLFLFIFSDSFSCFNLS